MAKFDVELKAVEIYYMNDIEAECEADAEEKALEIYDSGDHEDYHNGSDIETQVV